MLRAGFRDALLEQNYLSGPELFCLDHPDIKCDLYGVDAPTLYRVQHHVAGLLQDSGAEFSRRARRTAAAFHENLHQTPADFAAVCNFVKRLSSDGEAKQLNLSALLAVAANYRVATERIDALPKVIAQYDSDAREM